MGSLRRSPVWNAGSHDQADLSPAAIALSGARRSGFSPPGRTPDDYLFIASLSAFAGWNVNFLAAATLIIAPVAGLRASRSGVSCRVGTTRCRAAPP